jgi:hypothetical protein
MWTMMDVGVPVLEADPAAPVPGEPICIFAALIDGLTSPERYTVETRNGELFVTPVGWRSEPRPVRTAAPGKRAA